VAVHGSGLRPRDEVGWGWAPCPGLPPGPAGALLRAGFGASPARGASSMSLRVSAEGSVWWHETTAFPFLVPPITSGGEGKRSLAALPHPLSYRKRKYFCSGALTCLLLVLSENVFCSALFWFLSRFPVKRACFYSVLGVVFLVTTSTPTAPLELLGSGGVLAPVQLLVFSLIFSENWLGSLLQNSNRVINITFVLEKNNLPFR